MKVNTFRADTHSIDKTTGEYRDPLMKWPLRGAAFTNEIGEALRPLIGGYATISWAPALMYIGADIYDKYKNDNTEYSPNSKRLLKQAIFQGMASILLPLVAVKAGQNIFSLTGRIGKDKVSLNSKEIVSLTAENFIANGQMRAFHGKDEECVKTFIDRVHNVIDFSKQEKNTKNPLVKTWNKIEIAILKFLNINNESLDKYATSTIQDLIEQRKNLLNPTEEFKSTKIYNDYVKNLNKGQTKNVAVKSALTKFQQNKMLKGRAIKTLGGFIALGSLIKPIDHFVDNFLIGKVLGPGIDNYERPRDRKKEQELN